MLAKLVDTNTALKEFNAFSSSLYGGVAREFQQHTRMLKDLRKDLDAVYKRIRALKAQMAQVETQIH